MRPANLRPLALLLTGLGLAACAGGANRDSAGPSAQTMRIADAALAAGTPQVALQVLEGTLAANPGNTDALVRQAKAQMMLGNATAAEASFRRAIAVDPHLTEARFGLGKVMMASNPAEAEKMFFDVLAAEPKNAQVINNLGVARDLQGHHAEAQEAYRRALATSPELTSAKQNLGLSLAISGKAEEGVSVLGPIAGNGRNDRRARDNLALALTLGGRSTEASQVLREEMNQADVARALNGYRALYTPAP